MIIFYLRLNFHRNCNNLDGSVDLLLLLFSTGFLRVFAALLCHVAVICEKKLPRSGIKLEYERLIRLLKIRTKMFLLLVLVQLLLVVLKMKKLLYLRMK